MGRPGAANGGKDPFSVTASTQMAKGSGPLQKQRSNTFMSQQNQKGNDLYTTQANYNKGGRAEMQSRPGRNAFKGYSPQLTATNTG